MTSFCCLCGNTEEADLGQVTGICSDAEACHRRQALASLESVIFTADTGAARRLNERLNSPTFAITGKTCEQVLAEGLERDRVGGVLTPAIVSAAMDALWSPARPGGRPGPKPFAAGSMEISGTIAVEFSPGAAEALMEMLRPRCGALLFPLPPRAPRPVEPVHPLDAPYFAPVQGPQPAACALDKDHRIGWHWYDGTWWKA